MKKKLFLFCLLAALTACEPTERTNPEAKRPHSPAQATQEAPVPAEPAPAEPTPAPAEPAPAEPTPAAQPEAPAAQPTDAIVLIRSTQQDYSPLLPWEKQRPRNNKVLGVSLGEGRVLTLYEPLKAATYLELSLPDESRNVPARILRYDEDMNLAIVSVLNEGDGNFLEGRAALELGAPLGQGAEAVVIGLINGLNPYRISGVVQGATEGMPKLNLRTAAPLPDDSEDGAPILCDGKLVGLSAGYEDSSQTLSMMNADMLARFMDTGHPCGTPLLGVQFTELDDPVMRRYLELPEGQTGLYVSKVIPGGAAEAAGLQEGDVITAAEGMPVDSRGRVNHPLYGPIAAASALRVMKPLGESVTLTLCRNGEQVELPVVLNRDLLNSPLRRQLAPAEAPRYILWGGLLFQPLTQTYLNALRSSSHGEMPLPFLRLQQQEKELAEQGIREVVALTLIIPTPATLGYEESRFSIVKAVNGKPIHDFAEFEQLLDEPTEDNITSISLDRAPYTLHLDRSAAETANDLIRRRGIPVLRVTKEK